MTAADLPLFSNPSSKENHNLGALISDGKLLQRVLEKILVAVLLMRFLFLFPFVIRRFILIIKLSIYSITQAHNVGETHAPDHISLG
jgi:hypothetical protein